MILWLRKQSVRQLCSGTTFYLLFLDISHKKIYVVIISEKPFNITDFHKIWTALHLLTGIQRQILSGSTASLAVMTTYSERHLKSLWNTSTASAYDRQKFSTPNVRTLQRKRCDLLWFLFFYPMQTSRHFRELSILHGHPPTFDFCNKTTLFSPLSVKETWTTGLRVLLRTVEDYVWTDAIPGFRNWCSNLFHGHRCHTFLWMASQLLCGTFPTGASLGPDSGCGLIVKCPAYIIMLLRLLSC